MQYYIFAALICSGISLTALLQISGLSQQHSTFCLKSTHIFILSTHFHRHYNICFAFIFRYIKQPGDVTHSCFKELFLIQGKFVNMLIPVYALTTNIKEANTK